MIFISLSNSWGKNGETKRNFNPLIAIYTHIQNKFLKLISKHFLTKVP